MKKAKIVFWVIVSVFIAVFIVQNKLFFMAKQSLSLKLPFLETYHTPELPHAVIFLVFFLTGFLIAYFFSLYDRYKTKKTIKNLNATTATQLEELAVLKSELESFQRAASSGPSTESQEESTEQTA